MRPSHQRVGISFPHALVLFLLTAARWTHAQSVEPARADKPPTIDGVLDDPAWEAAPMIDAFTQVDPLVGAPPSEPTEVRILFDDDAIYFAIRCLDREPGRVVATQMKRDDSLDADDHVVIVLDTFDDDRTGYMFQIGAAGGRLDAIIHSGGSTNADWDGLWDGRARVNDEGWAAEVAIPFKTLSFDPRSTRWGFNVQRTIARRQEVVRWAGARREIEVTRVADAGQITGLSGMRQGHGLTVKPFLTATLDADSGDLDLKPGLDLFYRVTPSASLALTLNTDFAETEVDERRVNLTRFPLFFPEKRDFFLEDAGIFEFGGIRQSPRPFHSRRIGIVGGEQKDILAGVRFTGRHGRLGFGLLDVQMKDDETLGAKNLAAARATWDVLDESTLGLIVTNGDPGERGNNTLLGADFNYRLSDAPFGGSFSASLWAMGTRSDPSGRDVDSSDATAVGGRFAYDAEPWEISLFAARIGEDFDPALGFVSATGRLEYDPGVTYTWRPESSWVRAVDFDFMARAMLHLDHEIDSVEASLPEIGIEFESGDQLDLALTWTSERLTEPFEVIDDIELPPGTYDNWGGGIGFETSTSRPLSAFASLSYQGFYDGTLLEMSGGVEARPSPHFYSRIEYEQSEGDLDQGSFVVRVFRARIAVLFTPDLSWDATFQWDDEDDAAGLNTRLRWEFEPGQELFIVYNEAFDSGDGRLTSSDRQAIVKVGLTWRY